MPSRRCASSTKPSSQRGQYAVKFLDQNGNEIGKRGILHNDSVPLDEIPDSLIKATLATEDRRFFEHWGIDVIGTARALFTNLQANEVVQGGSSITQQVAKNLFLSSERSMQRKIKEAFLALLLESRLSKREILKLYFDRAYMGGGAFGVEAASQYYFGKSVRQINLAESALLAGLFKAPTKFAPHVNLPASRARTNDVLNNLVESGFYTSGQVHNARINPAKIIETRNPNSPDWFLDWAFEEVQRVAAGRGQYVLTARTTIDLNMQKATDEALTTALKQYRGSHITSGAIVLLETDGAVKALTGGPDYGESQFNRATHAKRQPGSSFKVYVYTTALENGYTPTTMVRDAARPCAGRYVSNYGGGGGGGGRLPLWEALARSLNTVAVELSFAVGPRQGDRDDAASRHHRHPPDLHHGDRRLRHQPARARGRHRHARQRRQARQALCHPRSRLVEGRPRLQPRPRRARGPAGHQALGRRTDELDAEQGRHRRHRHGGQARLHQRRRQDGHQRPGPKDVWFVGFTGKYTGVVWLGNDDNRPMASGTTGGHFAAPVWHSFMSVVHTDMNIPTIPGLQPHPVQVAEQQRIAAMRAEGTASAAGDPQNRSSSLMPDQTREVLKHLADELRQAAGRLAGTPPPYPEAAQPKPVQRENRAELQR